MWWWVALLAVYLLGVKYLWRQPYGDDFPASTKGAKVIAMMWPMWLVLCLTALLLRVVVEAVDEVRG